MKRLLHAAFFARSTQAADAIAIVDRDRRTSYGALAGAALRRARRFVELGLAPGDRVGLFAPKSTDVIEAMLAVLAAGGVYVPLDPQSPPPRLAKILASCAPRFVVVAPRLTETLAAALAAAGSDATPLPLDDPAAAALAPLDDPWRSEPDDAAHLLYTSGSTGEPKGVVITHRNVLAFLDWAVPHFHLGPGERRSGHPPLHFDLSTFDVHGSLGSGAELHLIHPETMLHAGQLAASIREQRLTQWFSVPSALSWLHRFEAIRPGDFPELRELLWCGEVLPTPTLQWLMERLPHARFTNLYGPTEATIASTWYELRERPTDPAAPIPIGRPCPGETALVLDDRGCEAGAGELGELCLGGVGLSPGYWRDPARTAAAFFERDAGPTRQRWYRTGDLARRDADGLLWFTGRRDAQIKSRGYRIELGEIEANLRALPGLLDAAVVAVPTDGFEGQAICCAFRPAAGATAEPAAIRAALARLLPPWMLPSHWLALPELPVNQNGKVDRPCLRELFATKLAVERPTSR